MRGGARWRRRREGCTLERRSTNRGAKIKKLTPQNKNCTTNNLKISCITNVKAAGADVTLKRGDGLEYKVRAGTDEPRYLCVEPTALTDCFGKKLH
jgi:hypothetical protein